MTDPITSIQPVQGPFDTAAMQIAMAQAQAAADHTNVLAFLKEIAKTNDETNAHALDSTQNAAQADNFLSSALLNAPPTDTAIDPAVDPATLPLFSEFGSNLADATTIDGTKAQQLHDIGVLKKDAELLAEAANENNHIPLNGASTVDLSPEAQGIISGIIVPSINAPALLTSAQLTQIGNILQPVASEPLTPALLQQIQAQLAAQHNSTQLSLNNIILAMNYLATLQHNPDHVPEKIIPKNDKEVTVAPVSAVEKIQDEDSTVRK